MSQDNDDTTLDLHRAALRSTAEKIARLDRDHVARDIEARKLDVYLWRAYERVRDKFRNNAEERAFCRSLGNGLSYPMMRRRAQLAACWDKYLGRRQAVGDSGRYGLMYALELLGAPTEDATDSRERESRKGVWYVSRATPSQSFGGRAVPRSFDSAEKTTPPEIFLRYGARCSFDLAATAANALCPDYFTKQQDALTRPWPSGKVMWANPPYSNLLDWCRRFYDYAERGGEVIALLPAWTDTEWFHRYCAFGNVTFLRTRRRFGGMKAQAPFPSIIVAWNPDAIRAARKRQHRGHYTIANQLECRPQCDCLDRGRKPDCDAVQACLP